MPPGTDNWIQFLSEYGEVLVFFGALFEGETIIVLAGVLSHQSVLPFAWTICAAATGAFTGDQLSFHIGRQYGSSVLTRFPRVAQQAQSVRPRIRERGDWIAFGCRFIYGTRIVTPILLGASGYSPQRFALINLVSAALWALAGVTAGYLVGTGAEKLLGRIEHLGQMLLVVLTAMLGWWWFRHHKLHQ